MSLVKSASLGTRMLGNGRCGYHAGFICMNNGAGRPVVVVCVGGDGGGGGDDASTAVLVVCRGGCRPTWAPRDLGQYSGVAQGYLRRRCRHGQRIAVFISSHIPLGQHEVRSVFMLLVL
ncbi:hypothetical protein BB8028_0003g04500 [Beauveria bassiana]|uniref:Uncharacterized protein n=1 Tax=Beauveria bassiana TaxID=176275 RepID=A0A2S7Y6X3_BEABA|nr:hypothetical protein BB8028_0003g04500 [Beauveria bassiana]